MNESKPFLDKFRVVNMVAVQNYMASGATFVQSLLDGHPAILSTPALYSRDIYGFWPPFSALPVEQKAMAFVRTFQTWFDPRHVDVDNGLNRLGGNMDESPVVDPTRFHQHLMELIGREENISRRRFFEACHLAYALALGRQLENELLFLFPVHTHSKAHAAFALEDYPEVKFLHTIRDPLATYNSIVRRWLRLNLDSGHSLLEAQLTHFLLNHSILTNDDEICGDRPYFPERGGQFRAIRLEDLHTRPEETLIAVCKWLGIGWHPCLMESTFNGLAWGNKPTSQKISGFNPSSVTNVRLDYVNALDRPRLGHVLRRRAEAWNYAKPAPWNCFLGALAFYGLLWAPFRAEMVRLPSRLRAAGVLEKRADWFPEGLRQAVALTAARERVLAQLTVRRKAHEMLEQTMGVAKTYHVEVVYSIGGETKFNILDEKDPEARPENMIDIVEAGDGKEKTGIFYRAVTWALFKMARMGLLMRDYVKARGCLLEALGDERRNPDRYVKLLPLEKGKE